MPVTEGNAAYDMMLVYRRGTQKKNGDGENQAPTATHRSSQMYRLRRVNHTSSLPMSEPKEPTKKTVRSLNPAQWKLVIAGGAALTVFGAFLLMSVNCEAQKNELSTQIAEKEASLQTLKNDYDGLMVEYDTAMSDAAIQEYAETELGMQKRENFQLEWIEVGEQNDFENEGTQNNAFIDWLASYFD